MWEVNWSTWHERRTKKKSESSTGMEPMASRTPGRRSIYWAMRTHGEQGHLTELRWFLRNESYRWIFETFPECSLLSPVSKNTIKMMGHHSRLRDVMGQSFVPVLVLITPVIHRSTLHFAVARNIVYKSNTRKKTWQVESVEHIEQYHIKFVKTSHYLKRRGREAVVESLFLRS